MLFATSRQAFDRRSFPRVELLEDRALLNAGTLDPTFGEGGRVLVTGGGSSFARAVVVQADGKIVVGGAVGEGDFATGELRRFNADGTPDTTFGSGGRTTTNLLFPTDEINAVALQPDGKILAAGFVTLDDLGLPSFGGDEAFAVWRFLPNGQPDRDFDGDGLAVADFRFPGGATLEARANALAVQADGRIVLGGSRTRLAGGFTDLALARFHSDGRLDNSFDFDGRLLTDVGRIGFNEISGLAIQADNKIVAVGTAANGAFGGGSDVVFARYLGNGSLDSSFGFGGFVPGTTLLDLNDRDFGRAVALQADGKIVVAGSKAAFGDDADFLVARLENGLTSPGRLDASFSLDGWLTADLGQTGAVNDVAAAVLVQLDGKILAAGTGGFDLAAARYTPNGTLDPSFDSDGVAQTSVLDVASHVGRAAALQADGRLVVVGEVVRGDLTSIGLIRYQADPRLAPPAAVPNLLRDVTAQVNVVLQAPRRNRRTGLVEQRVTLVNVGGAELTGPVSLVLDRLGKRIRLRSAAGVTRSRAPLGSRFVTVVPAGRGLMPGERVTFTLRFRVPAGRRLRFTPRVLAGEGER